MAMYEIKLEENLSYVEVTSAQISDEMAQQHHQKNVSELDESELKSLLYFYGESTVHSEVVDDSSLSVNEV